MILLSLPGVLLPSCDFLDSKIIIIKTLAKVSTVDSIRSVNIIIPACLGGSESTETRTGPDAASTRLRCRSKTKNLESHFNEIA